MKKLFKRLMAYLPTKLPAGRAEFDDWANDIIELYDAPNNDSVKFSLAVMIMHLGPTEARKSKEYFGRTLHKGAATQVAHAVMQELKTKQQEEIKKLEEDAKNQAEAQAAPVEAHESKE